MVKKKTTKKKVTKKTTKKVTKKAAAKPAAAAATSDKKPATFKGKNPYLCFKDDVTKNIEPIWCIDAISICAPYNTVKIPKKICNKSLA